MNDFVEQCRREWKRLGVPDPLAEEMAADLACDLGEAEAEGVSLEEFLGSSAFDPRSFAASWAAERGIVPAPSEGRRRRRRPLVLVAFTALSALALLVAALLLLTGQPRVQLTATRVRPSHLQLPSSFLGPRTRHVVLQSSASAPVEWILLGLAIAALAFAAWLWSARSRSGAPGLEA